MDTVFLRNLKVEAIIGIFDWERKVRQPILISLDMAYDISKAAKTNDIQDALNYKDVADRVTDFVVFEKFELLESLAEGVASLIMEEFNVNWLSVSCCKPTVMQNVDRVGVTIERGKR